MQGCHIKDHSCNAATLEAVVEAAKTAQAAVVCVGEENYAEKPGNINDLLMTGRWRSSRFRARLGFSYPDGVDTLQHLCSPIRPAAIGQ